MALFVAVGRNWGDGWFLNLLLIGVVALFLVAHHIVVLIEVAACEVGNLRLGHTLDALDLLHFLAPFNAVDKRVDHHIGASAVALNRLVIVAFRIVDNRCQQFVAKFATAHLCYFIEDKLACLIQRLPFLWHSINEQHRVVGHQFAACASAQHFHFLVEVEVNQTGIAVAQQHRHHFQRVALGASSSRHTPCHSHVRRFLTHHGSIDRCGDRRHRCKFGARKVFVWLPFAEVALNHVHCGVEIKVASKANCHIVGAIVAVEVVFDVGD